MMNILLGMQVRCTGQQSAKVSGLLMRLEDRSVTHLLVKQGHTEHLVRLHQVQDVVDGVVILDGSALDLKALPLFVHMEYIRTPVLHYDVVPGATRVYEHNEIGAGMMMTRNIPDGTGVLNHESAVYALDGQIGHLTGAGVDLSTGMISAIGVRTGHLWNSHQIVLPADLLSDISGESLYVARRQADLEHVTI
jgi:hypothetical protein